MTKPLFSATLLTLFPEMFPGPLGHSLAGTALEKGLWSLEALNIRDFASDKHRTVDDSPYGGGVGMVMKPDVVDAAVEAAKQRISNVRCQMSKDTSLDIQHPTSDIGCEATIIYTSPRGVPFTQALAQELSQQSVIILCGRFEGVDQRVIDHHHMLEVSLGDFVLSGGEIAALAMLDACVRLIPGVIGKEEATQIESFSLGEESARLLEFPHYTRPPSWKGLNVPEVLLSGNHKNIEAWRHEQAKKETETRRPDLMQKLKKKG